jgi:hypothetical protein
LILSDCQLKNNRENTFTDLHVSPAFNNEATNAKLKGSTHVVVDEVEEEEGEKDGDYEKVREGPATAGNLEF